MRRNLFSDKASLVLRRMLREPGRRWVVRDFVGPGGVSIGLAQAVCETLEAEGFAERTKRGAAGFTLLTNPDLLIEAWVNAYSVSRNVTRTFYQPGTDRIRKIEKALAEIPYAFTLHAGADFPTSWVRTDQIHFYLDDRGDPEIILKVRQKLGLLELKTGGNVHILRPYYARGAFFNDQKTGRARIVSYLQLYLDLYHYRPRGREHAERLKEMIHAREGVLA
jgi:hypothetical protein